MLLNIDTNVLRSKYFLPEDTSLHNKIYEEVSFRHNMFLSTLEAIASEDMTAESIQSFVKAMLASSIQDKFR